MSSPSPGPLRLRRGVPVIDRPPGLVQVGTDPERSVLLPDTVPVRELLAGLTGNGAARPSRPVAVEVLERLTARDLVVDRAERLTRGRSRAARRVLVQGPDPWRGDLTDLLTAAGVKADTDATDGREPALHVLLSAGEPDRSLVDDLAAASMPSLHLGVIDARIRVGPFVVPGLTACLRCLDCHGHDRDPDRPLEALPEIARRGTEFPADVPPLAMHLALVLLAGDVLAWVDGRRPESWSAATWVSDDLGRTSQSWTRHPHCGCAWQDLLQAW